MTALNKQALREAANAANIASWGKWESYKPHKGARGYEVKVGAKAVAQHCLKADSAFIAAANPSTVLALLDELESAEKRIAELEASHSKLRDTMAGIHNTIRMDGGYTPLAAILNAAKRAYEDSATAAGIGVKGERLGGACE